MAVLSRALAYIRVPRTTHIWWLMGFGLGLSHKTGMGSCGYIKHSEEKSEICVPVCLSVESATYSILFYRSEGKRNVLPAFRLLYVIS